MFNRYALLFGYTYTRQKDVLESSCFDLYLSYSYLRDRGFHSFIFDDFDKTNTILTDKAEGNFLSFYYSEKSDNCDRYGKQNPFDCITDSLTHCNNLFIYYTGHMTADGNLCFPFGEMHIKEFFHKLSQCLPKSCQIFCIMDCCYSGNITLPYVFQNGEFALRTNFDNNVFPITQPLIYLHSSSANETAVSSQFRSHFTKYVFAQLSETTVCFDVLLYHVQKCLRDRRIEAQTCGIQSSKLTQTLVWPWVFGFDFLLENEYFIVPN